MNHPSDRALYWSLLAVQAAASQVIIWGGIPTYQRLHSGGNEGASSKEFVIALVAVIVMQAAHWASLPVGQRLQFGRNVLLGHVLVCVGELSLFFVAALSSLILFDRLGDLEFALWKLFVLVALVFAASSYKYQLMSLGALMIEIDPEKQRETNPA